jgi:hypothetical protein
MSSLTHAATDFDLLAALDVVDRWEFAAGRVDSVNRLRPDLMTSLPLSRRH